MLLRRALLFMRQVEELLSNFVRKFKIAPVFPYTLPITLRSCVQGPIMKTFPTDTTKIHGTPHKL